MAFPSLNVMFDFTCDRNRIKNRSCCFLYPGKSLLFKARFLWYLAMCWLEFSRSGMAHEDLHLYETMFLLTVALASSKCPGHPLS